MSSFVVCFLLIDTEQVSYDSQAEVLSISFDVCFMGGLGVRTLVMENL